MQSTKLPSGKIIKNIPEGMTQEELKRILLANGAATEEDFQSFSVGDFLEKNLDLPGGVAG